MVFSTADRILIKNLVFLKEYSRLMKEFPQKGWNGIRKALMCCYAKSMRRLGPCI